ncbi:ABC transporter permease [bacterium]|nr:ABC transporter permease [bacterium]
MVRYALKELSRHRTRTAANVAGYALAVAFLVAAVSVAQSHARRTLGILSAPGTKFVVFKTAPNQEAFKDGGPLAEGVYTAMMRADDVREIEGVPGVTSVAPYLLFRKDHGGPRGLLTIAGLDMGRLHTWETFCAPNDLILGRFITPDDTAAVILEESFARASGRHVDEPIVAFGREFRIVGIVNTNIRPVKPDMYAPLPVVQQIVREGGRGFAGDMNILLVAVAEPRVQDVVMAAVQKLMPNAVLVTYNCYRPARTGILMTTNLVWVVSLVIALFVILFAGKSQAASVIERRRDIGVLKAIGWSNRRVVQQVLAESFIQAVAGAVIGSFVGLLALLAVFWGRFHEGNVALPSAAMVIGIAIALLGGVAAGLVPAWRAYRLKPAEALRRL